MDAASQPGLTSATLGVNWRSDQVLLDALDAVFDGATLGHPQIAYRRVRAAPDPRLSLEDTPQPTPLRVRVVHRADGHVKLIRSGTVDKGSARELIATDLSSETITLSHDELRERMSGNLCRCGAYNGIVAAITEVYVTEGVE